MAPHRVSRGGAAALLAGVLLLGGCSGRSQSSDSTTTIAPTGPCQPARLLAATRELLAVRIDACPTQERVVPGSGGSSQVTSEGGAVFVSGDGPNLGGFARLDGNKFVAMDFGTGIQFSHSVHETKFAYSLSPRGGPVSRIAVFDMATREERVVMESTQRLTEPDWSPSGELAFSSQPRVSVGAKREPMSVVVLGADGSTRAVHPLPILGAAIISWGPLIAVTPGSDDPWETALLDPVTGAVQVVKGWRGLDWSPDGKFLIFQGKSMRLGVSSADDPTHVIAQGSPLDHVLIDATWVG